MRSVENYALSRGAYSAFLLARGLATPWAAWDRSRLRPLTSGERLRLVQLEFEGATRYLAGLAGDSGAPADDDAMPLSGENAEADLRHSTAASSSAV